MYGKYILNFYKTVAVLAASVLIAGCSTYDHARVRDTQIESFTNSLLRASGELLSKPLSLDDAIAIALTNNYEVRKADLDVELAKLGKTAAFAAFLPRIEAKAGYYSYRDDPLTTSRSYENGGVALAMPLLMPSTWFLYAAQRHGYAAGRISAFYTRQSIALRTTQDYFNILVQQSLIDAYSSQYKAALEGAQRIEGLAKEGIHAVWEADRASVIALSRKVQLSQAMRNMGILKARFLANLGLDPRSDFSLAGVPDEVKSTNSLDEIVIQALTTHPVLALADRQVVMKEHAVRSAVCDFLPNVSFVAEKSWTGNEVSVPSENLLASFSGTWSIINAASLFSNYKISKVERRKAELERENSFLNVIVNVVASYAALRDSEESLAVKSGTFDVASQKYADYDAKAREGVMPVSDALDALAERDLAEVELIRSRFDARLAKAALDFASGSIETGFENDIDDLIGRQ